MTAETPQENAFIDEKKSGNNDLNSNLLHIAKLTEDDLSVLEFIEIKNELKASAEIIAEINRTIKETVATASQELNRNKGIDTGITFFSKVNRLITFARGQLEKLINLNAPKYITAPLAKGINNLTATIPYPSL